MFILLESEIDMGGDAEVLGSKELPFGDKLPSAPKDFRVLSRRVEARHSSLLRVPL